MKDSLFGLKVLLLELVLPFFVWPFLALWDAVTKDKKTGYPTIDALAFGLLGLACLAVFASELYSEWGWKWTFIVLAIIAYVILFLMYDGMQDDEYEYGYYGGREKT